MAGDKVNPSDVWGPNENYADRVGLSPAIGIVLENGGLSVDRGAINKTMGGSGSESQSKPLGAPESRPGY